MHERLDEKLKGFRMHSLVTAHTPTQGTTKLPLALRNLILEPSKRPGNSVDVADVKFLLTNHSCVQRQSDQSFIT